MGGYVGLDMGGSGVSAELLNIEMTCRKCGAGLTIEEAHYYADANGKANCEACELQWMLDVRAWRNGDLQEFPAR